MLIYLRPGSTGVPSIAMRRFNGDRLQVAVGNLTIFTK